MKNPGIIFEAVGKAVLCDFDIPEPGDNEVLLRIESTTISSGTERANLMGDLNVSIYTGPAKEAVFPRACGYSASGVIEKVGKNVDNVKVGDRVVGSWTSHKRYVCLDKINVHKIYDDKTTFSEASVVHIATFPLAAVRKTKLELGESGIVMGLGILGLVAVQLLKAGGAAPVIAVDSVAEKREFALSLGADYALDPFEEGFAEKVKEITGGGANVAIEVTGNGKALDMVLDCMAQFGRVALLGCTRNSDFTIDYYRKVHGPGISLIGAHTQARHKKESAPNNWTDHDDAMAILRLLSLGRIDFKKLVGEIHSPAEAPEVFCRLATEKNFPVVQFDWSKI